MLESLHQRSTVAKQQPIELDKETRAFLAQQFQDLQSYVTELGTIDFELCQDTKKNKTTQIVSLVYRSSSGQVLRTEGRSSSLFEACIVAKNKMTIRLQTAGMYPEDLAEREFVLSQIKQAPYLH